MNTPFTDIPTTKPPTVEDAMAFESKLGPWATKSGGELTVLFAFNKDVLSRMFQVEQHELDLVPELELGIRAFQSTGLETGTIGGKHFHRIKQEVITITKGSAEFTLEDVYGNVRTITIDKRTPGLYIPPFVMHTYKVLEPATLIGVSNTLYNADVPATHDTYEDETFQLLQDHFKQQ
jgi:dTDP-4-dehydrorhamnose 3,5-epimerase-like enzyme